MRGVLIVAWLIVGIVGCGPDSQTHTLSWDSNTEPDMKEYRIHRIPTMTEYTIVTPANLFAIAEHSPGIERQQIQIPDERQCYFVIAVNHAQQVSPPSETVCLN